MKIKMWVLCRGAVWGCGRVCDVWSEFGLTFFYVLYRARPITVKILPQPRASETHTKYCTVSSGVIECCKSRFHARR